MPRLPEGSPLACPLCGNALVSEAFGETYLIECHGWSAPLSAFADPGEEKMREHRAWQETRDALRWRDDLYDRLIDGREG